MKPIDTERKKEKQTHIEPVSEAGLRPVITLDYARYERYLEDADLSEEQKREFIGALWKVIVSFVDLGFGVHPAQQAQESCGKLLRFAAKPALTGSDELECGDKSLTREFEDTADLRRDTAVEGVE